MAKTLYLMRHGQTLFNLRHKVQGWCDAPLTDFGIYQAKVAGQYFKDAGITFDDAYSSTQERACDTLELVTDGKISYKRIKGLKEWNFGTFEGESEDLNPPLPYGDFFVTYGGESQEQVQARMATTVLKLMQETDGQSVLMVSHGGYDNSDVNKDINCMFPIDRLHELAKDGVIKAVAPVHIGFMGGGGNQEKFKNETGPEIARILKDEGVDAVILTAG